MDPHLIERGHRGGLGLVGLLLVLSIAAWAGAQILTPDGVDVASTPDPTESAPVTTLERVVTGDWSVNLSIPSTWSAVGQPVPEYRHFAGLNPEGHLSASHESPYAVTICDPTCAELTVRPTIPYAAPAQLERLKHEVETRAESTAWQPLLPEVLEDVEGGLRLESVALIDGRSWKRTYVIGLRDRNLVAIAWAQPVDTFDKALFDAVLAGMSLPPAPVYSDGDLAIAHQDRFELPVPGLWATTEQPAAANVPLSGVVQFGDGELVVSIGSTEGRMGWCDPECRVMTEQTSLDVLEAAVRGDVVRGQSKAITLDGETARVFDAPPSTNDSSAIRRYVVAMHDGSPLALLVDTREWDIAQGTVDEMIAGFRFVDPAVVPPPDQTFTLADGRVELALPSEWYPDSHSGQDLDTLHLSPRQLLTVGVGSRDGAIVTCARPAAPWELCREVTVSDLEELAKAVQPAPIADHGVGPPTGVRTELIVDGEAAVMTRIQAYEYPARSGQEVVYIATFHDGRPYLVRIRTTANEVRNLDFIIAGLRFVD
jgi:hypothetical protein